MLLDIDKKTHKKWQSLIDALAVTFNVPAVLIMHLENENINVFSASNSPDNPYKKGMGEIFQNSGLYCERVIKSQEKLLVANALNDPEWDQNPDIKLNMISYLGYPVNYPDGSPFGTICILDNKENPYSKDIENLLLQIKVLLEDQLLLLYQRVQLIKTIHGIVPICASCLRVRTENDTWISVAEYITEHTNASVSHGLCDECTKKFMESI